MKHIYSSNPNIIYLKVIFELKVIELIMDLQPPINLNQPLDQLHKTWDFLPIRNGEALPRKVKNNILGNELVNKSKEYINLVSVQNAGTLTFEVCEVNVGNGHEIKENTKVLLTSKVGIAHQVTRI